MLIKDTVDHSLRLNEWYEFFIAFKLNLVANRISAQLLKYLRLIIQHSGPELAEKHVDV